MATKEVTQFLSKAGSKGFRANMERVMREQGFSTLEEAKEWYFSEIGSKGGRPRKTKEEAA